MPRARIRQSPRKFNVTEEMPVTVPGRKRKRSKIADEIEKVKKSPKTNKDRHDKYCWKCHKQCEDLKCSTCVKAYCFKCAAKSKFDEKQRCSQCQAMSSNREQFSTLGDPELKKLIIYIFEISFTIDNDKKTPLFMKWEGSSEDNDKLCCIVDYRLIHSKAKDTESMHYRSPQELVDDVKWIHHNCIILYGEKSESAKAAKKIVDKFNSELTDLSDCIECYLKKASDVPLFFLNICKKPHPIIWAKVKGHPYWPAKCLRVVSGKAHVRFFHTHQMASVPLKSCYFMSDKYPVKQSEKKPETADFHFAEQELLAYISVFKDTFGEFPLAFECEPKCRPECSLKCSLYDPQRGENAIKELLEKRERNRINASQTIVSSEEVHSPTLGNTDHCEVVDEICAENNPELGDVTVDLKENPQMDPDSSHSEDLNAISLSDTTPNGHLLPGNHHPGYVSPQHSLFDNFLSVHQPSDAQISISNVISGDDLTSTSLDSFSMNSPVSNERMDSAIVNIYNSLPQTETLQARSSSTAPDSSGTLDVYYRNQNSPYPNSADRNFLTPLEPDEDDDIQIIEPEEEEVATPSTFSRMRYDPNKVLHAILTKDPASESILNNATMLVKQLFIQFWGTANQHKNAPNIIHKLENKVVDLSAKLKESESKVAELTSRLANADKVVKATYGTYKATLQTMKDSNNQSKEDHLTVDINRHNEEVLESKSRDWCSLCQQPASIFCCYNTITTVNYCSTKCQTEDTVSIHGLNCKKFKKSERGLPTLQQETNANTIANILGMRASYKRTVETQIIESNFVPSAEANSSSPPMWGSSSQQK